MILADKRRDALIAEYCGAFDLYPVWIIGNSTAARARIGHGHGYDRWAERLRAPDGDPWDMVAVYWCDRKEAAELVVGACRLAQVPKMSFAGGDSVLRECAVALGVLLHTSDSLQDDAIKVIAAVDAQLQAMQDAGELQSVNRSYREYRLKKTELREPYLGYVTWFAQYRATLVRAAAEIMRTKKWDMKSDIENLAMS